LIRQNAKILEKLETISSSQKSLDNRISNIEKLLDERNNDNNISNIITDDKVVLMVIFANLRYANFATL